MPFFYLHGFASSPASGKARFFRDRLAEDGVTLHAPDFNQPDFTSLTVTRMLDQVDAAIEAQPAGEVTLFGSSLGGFVALHAAARRNRVPGQARPIARLVLLAPALAFGADDRLAPYLEDWRKTGRREVFHYAYGRPMPIGYDLYTDARRYDSTRLEIDVPTLIFQGSHDEVVSPGIVEAFARRRPNVTLRLLDDDHLLQRHLAEMWRESEAFLGLR